MTTAFLSSKARVHAALERRPADRVPIWMWYHPDTTHRLAEELEIGPADVANAMGDDIRQTWVGGNHAMEGIVHEHEGEMHTDVWGIEWVKLGHFNQISRHPLTEAGEPEIRAYRHPHHAIDDLLSNMDRLVGLEEEYFIGCDISPCLFEMVHRILAASHAVPPETPLENVSAMYEAAGVTKEHIFDRASDLRNS